MQRQHTKPAQLNDGMDTKMPASKSKGKCAGNTPNTLILVNRPRGFSWEINQPIRIQIGNNYLFFLGSLFHCFEHHSPLAEHNFPQKPAQTVAQLNSKSSMSFNHRVGVYTLRRWVENSIWMYTREIKKNSVVCLCQLSDLPDLLLIPEFTFISKFNIQMIEWIYLVSWW